MYDIKDSDDGKYRAFTGQSNELIIENLHKLHDRGAHIIIRLPIIPGCNDRADHFQGVADLLDLLPDIAKAEVVPYHRFGKNKPERYGLGESDRAGRQPPDPDVIEEWVKQFQHLGVNASVEI